MAWTILAFLNMEAHILMLWFHLSLTEVQALKATCLQVHQESTFADSFPGLLQQASISAVSSLTFENPSSISNRSATNSIYCFIKVQFIPIRPTGNASVRNSWKLKYRWHLEKWNLRGEKERRHLCFTVTQFVIFQAPQAVVWINNLHH